MFSYWSWCGIGGAPGTEGETCELLGNILIIQEEGCDSPDDNERGGMIVFDFFEPAELVYEMGFLDIEEEESTVTISHLSNSGMTMTTVFDLRNLGDNSKQVLDINIDNVTQIKVTLGGSGAVTFIDFCYNPDLVVPSFPTRVPSASPTRAPTMTGSGPPSIPTAAPVSREPTVAQPSKAPIEGPPTPAPETIEITIDFNTDGTVANPGTPIPHGAYLENEWEEYSLLLMAEGGFGSLPRAFDTKQVGNELYGDPDLGSPNFLCTPPGPGVGTGGEPGMPGENCEYLGNVLIIQENNSDTSIPDDNADGGKITLEFNPPAIFVNRIGLLDVDYKTDLIVTQTDGTVTVIPVPILGDNSKQSVLINLPDVSKIELVLTQSGAIIDITYSYVVDSPLLTPPPTVPGIAPTPSPADTPPPNGFPTIDMSMSMSMSM